VTVTATAEQQQRAAGGGEGRQAKTRAAADWRDAAGVEDWKAG
jgi:hypothetical protein